jgi:hypothetical protein
MRNWMIIGYPNAGWRSAVIYTIVGTCKLINLNSEGHLTRSKDDTDKARARGPPATTSACEVARFTPILQNY